MIVTRTLMTMITMMIMMIMTMMPLIIRMMITPIMIKSTHRSGRLPGAYVFSG